MAGKTASQHRTQNRTKPAARKPAAKRPASATVTAGGDGPATGYKVLGTTSDGVRIILPKGKPKAFTTARLRKAIRTVIAERSG
jgi:hypothetical protein